MRRVAVVVAGSGGASLVGGVQAVGWVVFLRVVARGETITEEGATLRAVRGVAG